MKKLLFTLITLLALAMPAMATDVVIAAQAIDGFNATNIGADQNINVSTAGGSPTVTSAALFPARIVGMSGFRVRIDNTVYAVASVESTSSLTLTSNYSGTPGAQVMTFYKWVEMRVYADRAFQPLGSLEIVQPGTVGSGNFFRRFAASVVNNGVTNQIFIPAMTLPATTDALITNQAKYTFPFYTPGGAQIAFFFCPSSLTTARLPPATPTTWAAICSFNSPPAIVPPNREAYSKAEIDARLPSCSQGKGVFFTAAGNILSCLTFGSGLTVTGSTLEASAGGSGYATVQEEGTPLAQRSVLNFIGTAFTAADEGPTRTNLSADPDLNALASIAGTGFAARTAADTWALRTHTGTANEITVANGAGVAGNPTYSLPAALTFTGKTITGGTYATPTITTPTITGGTHTAITGLGVRSTGSGAFDLRFANTENLTADRTLTITLNNAARTLSLNGNLTTGGAFSTTGTFSTGGNFSTGSTFATTGTFSTGGNFSTSSTFSTTGAFSTAGAFTTVGANALTFTTTGATGVTLPTSGTLATLAGTETLTNKTFNLASNTLTGTTAQFNTALSDGDFATLAGTETLTNKTLTSPRIGTAINDTNGNELFTLTATGSAVNEISITNGAPGTGPTIAVSGGDANPNLSINAKGTGRVVIKGYAYALEVNTTTVNSTGAGPDTLHSFSLPANSLDNDGDFIEVEYGFIFAADDDDKGVQATFGGTEYVRRGLGATDIDGIIGATIKATIVRLSSTSVYVSATLSQNLMYAASDNTFTGTSANGGLVTASNIVISGLSNLDSNAITMAGQSLGVNAGDVSQRLSIIKLTQR